MDKQYIINFLHTNKDFLQKKYDVKKIGLFGSYVRNDQTNDSDIDILVDMPSNFDNYYDLKEFLETNLQKNVDLGLVHTIREYLKPNIYKEVEYV